MPRRAAVSVSLVPRRPPGTSAPPEGPLVALLLLPLLPLPLSLLPLPLLLVWPRHRRSLRKRSRRRKPQAPPPQPGLAGASLLRLQAEPGRPQPSPQEGPHPAPTIAPPAGQTGLLIGKRAQWQDCATKGACRHAAHVGAACLRHNPIGLRAQAKRKGEPLRSRPLGSPAHARPARIGHSFAIHVVEGTPPMSSWRATLHAQGPRPQRPQPPLGGWGSPWLARRQTCCALACAWQPTQGGGQASP